ncbi:TraR/DksA family transcriptional regulator [Halofilum ochraceum]|uniref:TraR/DksA family transcriptional regulator n=1 Tax=Halofilum ochraceum TaxID=1611323 RepID=UPI000829A22B|nr:TraR/DksA family transcriptional regulator [Halofilum ochraceum]
MTARLTPQQTERLAAVLAGQRAALTRTIDHHIAQHAQTRFTDLVGQVGDLEDHALADLLVDDELAGIQREIGELREILAAEDRLGRGAYGTCIDCGEPVVFERLLARPTASRCLACQERHEKAQARPDHPTL